jgi:hypothetical protein
MSKSHTEAVSPHLKWWSAWQIIARARRSSILRLLPVFFPGEDLSSRTRRWDKINTYQRYIMLFLSNMYRIRQTHNAATYPFRLFRCAWKGRFQWLWLKALLSAWGCRCRNVTVQWYCTRQREPKRTSSPEERGSFHQNGAIADFNNYLNQMDLLLW